MSIANEFFSLSPKYRTKKNLNKIVSREIKKLLQELLNGDNWTGGHEGDFGIETQVIRNLIERFKK